MENKNMRFVEIVDLIHLGGTSYEIVEKFNQLIAMGIIDVNEIKLITINYDTSKGDVEKGPVRIYFANGIEIHLNLAAGYKGSGPNDLCKILELCNFKFDKNDIISNQHIVNLKYIKDPDLCYQFQKYDGSYEYSM